MIEPHLKRALGQMIRGVQVVATTHDDVTRAYCSHWISQVSFEEPVIMASVSPKHDTHPLLVDAGWFTVSVLTADQFGIGQYFSYPGRRFHHIAGEYLEVVDGMPVVKDCITWMRAEWFERKPMFDHELFFARVTRAGTGCLREPPLLYSPRHGWRVTGDKAREPGTSVRDELLKRLAAAGYDARGEEEADEG